MPVGSIISLTSCTVFWQKDLGMSTTKLDELRRDSRAARKLADEIEVWLDANAKGVYDIYGDGVWFLEQRDAVLFKTFWHGRFS